MSDVERLILEAWEKLRAKILSNPDELAKRLARRRQPIMTRPPRAWCLALRASDRRITPAHWVVSPEHAMDLDHPEHPYEPMEHTVTIQPYALRKFCRPVRTDSWGQEVADVARELGASKQKILAARHAGKFTERRIKGLGGKWGKPVPLIHSWTALDPAANFFSRPYSIWGPLWEFFPDMIPDNFEQTLTRRPWLRRMNGTPAPPPEDHLYKDECQHIGWHWVCPACKREVRKVFYPLPVPSLFDSLYLDPGSANIRVSDGEVVIPKPLPKKVRDNSILYDVNQPEPPPPTFACKKCHRIDYAPRTKAQAWNQLVTFLTRGLLFGREVPTPTWYKTERTLTRRRQLNAKPPIKREAIFNRLRIGLTFDEIAERLLIPRTSVTQAIRHICKQHGVKNRHELAKKLGWNHPQPLSGLDKHRQGPQRQQLVEELLLQNLSYTEIAHKIGLQPCTINQIASRIYKTHGLEKHKGRKALLEKFGLQLPKL